MTYRQMFALIVAIFLLATPAHAGKNKTNAAFVKDIDTVISEVTSIKGAESSEIAELKMMQKEHNKLFDNAYKVQRYEFYAKTLDRYKKLNKIYKNATGNSVTIPGWIQ